MNPIIVFFRLKYILFEKDVNDYIIYNSTSKEDNKSDFVVKGCNA